MPRNSISRKRIYPVYYRRDDEYFFFFSSMHSKVDRLQTKRKIKPGQSSIGKLIRTEMNLRSARSSPMHRDRSIDRKSKRRSKEEKEERSKENICRPVNVLVAISLADRFITLPLERCSLYLKILRLAKSNKHFVPSIPIIYSTSQLLGGSFWTAFLLKRIPPFYYTA